MKFNKVSVSYYAPGFSQILVSDSTIVCNTICQCEQAVHYTYTNVMSNHHQHRHALQSTTKLYMTMTSQIRGKYL